MEDSIKLPNELKDKEVGLSDTMISKDLVGRITDHIGTGRNAKDSFVWMTITRSFYVAAGISFLAYIGPLWGANTGEGLLESITAIWSIFVPIITLALGYAFGRGE